MELAPVILAGGSGSRLWPLSRQLEPKQFLALAGEKTMLQETLLRLSGLGGEKVSLTSPVVVCNDEHRFLVAEQLRQLGEQKAQILLEPVGRNTAPALTVAALTLAHDSDAFMLVMPADHVIRQVGEFHFAVRTGMKLAEQGLMVAFGIVPDKAETGYGYIEKGLPLKTDSSSYSILSFREKPDSKTAIKFVESGRYLWNSGMFIVTARRWLELIGDLNPRILEACKSAIQLGTAEADFFHLNSVAFESSPSDSIDYAVMERLADATAAVIPLSCSWSDVGAWPALWDIRDKDAEGNVVRGDVFSGGNHGSLVLAEHRMVAALGLENVVVVETADAVLVAHKDHAQDVKEVVGWLNKAGRDEHISHRRVARPWGSYETIDFGDRYKVKRITVKPKASLSLQMHHHRAEHWIVVRGTARVTRGDDVFLVSENQSTYIPIGTSHRLENPGAIPLEMIEVQSGAYLAEDDIVRFEDSYGRRDG